MLQRLREALALVLIGLLPFHAFLVTVLTKVINGPGSAPMGAIAIWKEGLLAVIVMIAFVELIQRLRATSDGLRVDILDSLIICLFFIGLVLVARNPQPATVIYGFRYDLLAPLAFIVLRRVSWSDAFVKRLLWVIVGAGSFIALYGIISLFLPASFFTWLGYSDLHSLYVPGGPLAPFQQLGSSAIRRAQSVMSGPNQLGLWLLLPWSIVLIRLLKGLRDGEEGIADLGLRIATSRKWKRLAILFVLSAALFATFSRSAWIAAAVSGAVCLWTFTPKSLRKTLSMIIGTFIVIAAFSVFAVFPQVILRSVSNRGHIERPLEAIQKIISQPLGYGLGTAGPASNRISDACVHLPEGSDASWAVPHQNLCVFVGDDQVQPTDRTCSCPLLPENWYLQIGVELGVLGMLIWIGLTVFMLKELQKATGDGRRGELAFVVFMAFLGISIAGLFLHSWEDSAVAMTVWLLGASAVSRQRND